MDVWTLYCPYKNCMDKKVSYISFGIAVVNFMYVKIVLCVIEDILIYVKSWISFFIRFGYHLKLYMLKNNV